MSKEYEIRVVGDMNDADYTCQISTISKKNLEKIIPLLERVKKFKPYKGISKYGMEFTHDHNYPVGFNQPRTDLGEKFVRDIYGFTEEEDEFLDEYIPLGEYGIHTLISVTVCKKPKLKKIF